jgi:hypothetical protein
MPHVRERQPGSDEPGGDSPRPDDADVTAALGALDAEQPQAPGRVNEDQAVTGGTAGSTGEAAPGGIPGDDASLEGGDPA